MLNDQNRRVCFFLDPIDQLDCLFTGGRIEICQRLIKQKDFYLIHHDSCKTDSLFLSARQFMRCIIQMILDSYQFCGMSRNFMHFILRCTTVFQCKRNVLADSQTNKLTIRVLQNSSYMCRQFKNTAVRCIYAIYCQRTFALAWIGKRIQTIHATSECTLTTSRWASDQHLFARINI